jgi:hypothetical protein
VLEQDFVRSGRVRFLATSEYRGEDIEGHLVVSLLTGAETTVHARKLVDGTYARRARRGNRSQRLVGGRPAQSGGRCHESRD